MSGNMGSGSADLQVAAAEAAPAMGPAADATPEAATEPLGGAASEKLRKQRSVLARLLSVAVAPWRGRSVSVTGGADGSTGGCQSSGASIAFSDAAVAPLTASLAELSSK